VEGLSETLSITNPSVRPMGADLRPGHWTKIAELTGDQRLATKSEIFPRC